MKEKTTKLLLKYLINKWLFAMIIIGMMIYMTGLSNISDYFKIEYLLLELICFILVTKFYGDSLK